MNHRGFASAVALAGSALLLAAGPALAQKNTKTTGQPRVDKTFMMKAAQGGMAEVELGKLAAQKASSPAVKQFAQHMVDDHSKANEELMSLAQSKGVTLPKSPGASHKAMMAKLRQLNGAAFDRTYMSDMVKDHKQDVAEFQKESKNGKDTDVKSWAGKTLPTLQQHLQMAMSTQKQVTARSGKSGNAAMSKGHMK